MQTGFVPCFLFFFLVVTAGIEATKFYVPVGFQEQLRGALRDAEQKGEKYTDVSFHFGDSQLARPLSLGFAPSY